MKVLAPAVTCLLSSHMKPVLRESIQSVLRQSRQDFELVILDSGQWIGHDDKISRSLADAHAQYRGHPLITWVTTGERPGLIRRSCPIAWVTNRAIEAGLVRGRYFCTFYDDDAYRPKFMERMADYLDANPDCLAVTCSQSRVRVAHDGTRTEVGRIPGIPRGPGQFDNQVDGAQIMFRREVLSKLEPPWLNEDPVDHSCRHSDGQFLERVAAVAGAVPGIDEILLEHHFTPYSTYTPS